MAKIIIDRINEIMSKVSPVISESSMTRIKHWLSTKDIAIITAYRTSLIHVTDNTIIDIKVGTRYTTAQKKERQTRLKSLLLTRGYGVTRMTGGFKEHGQENHTIEESLFVVNLKDDPTFFDNIVILGEKFNQDSILYKGKDDEVAFGVVTNNSDDLAPVGTKFPIGKLKSNVNAQFMSRIKNMGFAFTSEDNPATAETNDTRPTFKDRKNTRTKKYNLNEITEMRRILSMESFDDLSNLGKYLCQFRANGKNTSLL